MQKRKQLRKTIREILLQLNEEDVFGGPSASTSDSNSKEVEDAFKDIESDIKTSDISGNENEAVGLTLAGVALSAPEIIKLLGKFVNFLSKIPGLKSLSGDKLIAIGDKYHHKIQNAFIKIMKKAGVTDDAAVKKYASILHHMIIALLLVAGGVSMAGLVGKGSIKTATLKGALNAVKTKEITSFLTKAADAIV
tara:strand:+ start:729 stop:1310 length:582 start_codon:yes stop_codon:yes gene_type:complete